MATSHRNNVILLGVLLQVCLLTPSYAQSGKDSRQQAILTGIQNWSDTTGVVVTKSAQNRLLGDVEVARQDVQRANPAISSEQLDAVAPQVVVAFLDRSQQNRPSASLPSLFEQYATGSGLVLPSVTDYPTLVINIRPPTPADFVVTIDGTSFPAGNATFRVTEGTKSILVVRGDKAPCRATVKVTKNGPNSLNCSL
jgi:hypothetical protein